MQIDEDAQLQALWRSLELARRWEEVFSQPTGMWKTKPESDLALDDENSHPYGVSPAAWGALTAAISHLGTLQNSLFSSSNQGHVSVKLHTHGQLTLVRGALENSSLAVWLLEPDMSADRILRRMQADWSERRELGVVADEIGTPMPESREAYEQKASAVLTRSGISPSKLRSRPSYGEIVKKAGEMVAGDSKLAFVLWKACSAVAHGELRGVVAYLSHVEHKNEASETDYPVRRVETSVPILVSGAMLAVRTTKAALRLYAQRSGAEQDSDLAKLA